MNALNNNILIFKTFTKDLTKEGYKIIIMNKLVPFFANYPGQLKLIQDNDPKHNSIMCRDTLIDHQITWVRC